MAGTDKGTGYNQCVRMEITEGDRMQKIAVQSLREEEDAPLGLFLFKLDILKNKRLRIIFTASPYTDKDSKELQFPV